MSMVNETYQALIDSDRVSPQTRGVLVARMKPDDSNYAPSVLTSDQFITLRMIAERLLPQQNRPGTMPIDLAQRIDQSLHAAEGDGWRYATLPADAEAFRKGLTLVAEIAETTRSKTFAQLNGDEQDSLLQSIHRGVVKSAKFDLQRWLDDLRALATQIYVSHPSTLATMGYSGIGDNQGGFVLLGIGRVEAWEPRASDETI